MLFGVGYFIWYFFYFNQKLFVEPSTPKIQVSSSFINRNSRGYQMINASGSKFNTEFKTEFNLIPVHLNHL